MDTTTIDKSLSCGNDPAGCPSLLSQGGGTGSNPVGAALRGLRVGSADGPEAERLIKVAELGFLKIEGVPILRQMMCVSPSMMEVPYSNVARPSSAQVISNMPVAP